MKIKSADGTLTPIAAKDVLVVLNGRQTPSRPATERPQPMTPADFGPRLWRRLHQKRDAGPEWLDYFVGLLPCGDCKSHFAKLLKRMSADFSSDEAFFECTVAWHNAVNTRIGKPLMSINDARALWQPARHAPGVLRLPRKLDRFYSGQTAALLCGGPSLSAVTPEQLAGKVTMAINNAATVIKPDLWIGCDEPQKFDPGIWHDASITKFTLAARIRMNLSDGAKAAEMPNVIALKTMKAWNPATWTRDSAIQWQRDQVSPITMVAALRLLLSLGFPRVELHGCDWQMRSDRPYAHTDKKDPAGCRKNNRQYLMWGERFAILRPHIEAAGMTVVNATRGSKLRAFDFA